MLQDFPSIDPLLQANPDSSQEGCLIIESKYPTLKNLGKKGLFWLIVHSWLFPRHGSMTEKKQLWAWQQETGCNQEGGRELDISIHVPGDPPPLTRIYLPLPITFGYKLKSMDKSTDEYHVPMI